VSGAPLSTGDRSLLDFFEVAIDKQGRANIALADNADAPGALLSAYTRQLTGYSLTTGKPLAPQVVRPPRLVCTADAAFTDPSGDANAVAVGTPLPSEPALDVTKGYLSADAQSLVLHTKVLDLSKYPPTGSTGIDEEFSFTFAKRGYVAVARHDESLTKDAFHLESPRGTVVGPAVSGAFDQKTNEIRIVIPRDFFAKAKLGPMVTKGSTVLGLLLNTRRSYPAALAPVADNAASLGCPFVVGAQDAAVGHGKAAPRGTTTVPAREDTRRAAKAH
jgi:hypothetical protein